MGEDFFDFSKRISKDLFGILKKKGIDRKVKSKTVNIFGWLKNWVKKEMKN